MQNPPKNDSRRPAISAPASTKPGRAWIACAAIVALALAGAAAVYPSDAPISDAVQRWFQVAVTPPLDFAIKTWRMLGKFDVVFLFMVFLCWATGNRRLLWRFACAAVPSGVFVLLVKKIVARPRPVGDDAVSFPSGDTSIAFVWATILAAEYPVLAVPALLGAAVIAFLRVAGGYHFPSDVIVGSAIGFGAACIAVYKAGPVPRWLYRAMQRTRWGLIGLGSFVTYAVVRCIVDKKWALILAAIVVPVTLAVVGIAKRRVFARYLRMRRARASRPR